MNSLYESKLSLRKNQIESKLNQNRGMNNNGDNYELIKKLSQNLQSDNIDNLYDILKSFLFSLSLVDNEIPYLVLLQGNSICRLVTLLNNYIRFKDIADIIFECLSKIISLIKEEQCYILFYYDNENKNFIHYYTNILKEYESDLDLYGKFVTFIAKTLIDSDENQNSLISDKYIFTSIYSYYNTKINNFSSKPNAFIPFMIFLSSFTKMPYDDTTEEFQIKIQNSTFGLLKQLYYVQIPPSLNEKEMLDLLFKSTLNISQSTIQSIIESFFTEDLTSICIIEILLSFYQSYKEDLLCDIVSILGNLLSNDKSIVTRLIKFNIIDLLLSNLQSESTSQRAKKLIVWAISNICNESDMIDFLFEKKVFSLLLTIIHSNPPIEILKEILWCIANGISSCDNIQCLEFLNIKIINELKQILTSYKDPDILLKTLVCFVYLLRKGNVGMYIDDGTENEMYIDNVYLMKFIEVGGEDILRHIANSAKNPKLISLSYTIIEDYFPNKKV